LIPHKHVSPFPAWLLVCCLLFSGLHAAALAAADYNNLGITSYDAGRFKDAIAYFQQAIARAPESEVVRRNLCNAHQAAANELAQKQDFAEAAKHLEKAIKVDPKNAAPLIQLGSYYMRLKMIPEAILRLESAIELQPGHVDAHELLGQAYYEDNDLPSARAQWDFVLEAAPDREYLRQQYEKAFREESVEYSFHRSESRHFRISYPQGVSRTQQSLVLTILERAYTDINRKFAVYPPGQVQVIVYSAEQFTEATQLDSHVGALFDGKIRIPLTDADGVELPVDELTRRLKHEYVHVVLRHIATDRVPWWLNEGLAETFSSELSEGDLALLRRAYAEGLEFSLADLEGSQLTALSPEALRLAYVQSHATTELLWNRYGQKPMAQLLSDLAMGVAPQDAIQRIYGRGYSSLEAEVAAAYG